MSLAARRGRFFNIKYWLPALALVIFVGAEQGYALQRAQKKVLDNGLTLLLLEQHALPFVTVEVSVRAGAVYDPPGKEGLANLTANLLTRGSEKYSAQELAEAIEFVGGSISSGANPDFSELSLTVLTKDLDLGFELLRESLTRPAFPGEEVEKERREIVGDIIQQKEDPYTVATKAFLRLVYGGHPYNSPTEGLEETVPKLERQDVLDFYGNYYLPDNTTLVVVGDIDQARLDELLRKHFSRWKKKGPKPPPIPEPRPLEKQKRELIDMDLKQATVLLGQVGIKRNNPDYYAVYVMNYILGGGGFSSRLLTNIRDNQGLAYSAASYFYTALHGGSFRATIQTKNENTARVVESTLAEIKSIQEELVSEEELTAAKSYLTGSFPLKLDTNSKVAGYLAYMENYGLGLDYFEKFPQYINAVTREQVREMARKYLDREKYLLVVAGKQSEVGLAGKIPADGQE